MKQWNLYAGILKILGLLVFLPLTGYILTINKTVKMYRNLKMREQLTCSSQDNRSDSSENLMVFNSNEDVKNGAVIKTLNEHIADSSIVTDSYVPMLNYQSNGFDIYTGEVILSGGFTSLTRLMEKLEKEKRGYRIASVQYRTVGDSQKRSIKLQMVILIQQVTKS